MAISAKRATSNYRFRYAVWQAGAGGGSNHFDPVSNALRAESNDTSRCDPCLFTMVIVTEKEWDKLQRTKMMVEKQETRIYMGVKC